jgi:superfamily II DNA helicase RecQ
MAHAQEKYDARLFIATINYLTDEVWSFLEDKMEVWDYRTILDYYDKYFFDPEAGWEEFENFMKRKEVYALELKQQMEFEELETRINKRKFTIERPSISQRDELNFEILREVRKVEAKRWEIYPNYVFSDAVLYEMVKRRPKTRLEFLRIP